MAHDFDRVIDRRQSDSSKWRKYGPDVLPLRVADMDFAAPPPVVQALRERVEHGVFGYGVAETQLEGVLVERLWTRYGWRVEPEAILTLPGVISGFNVAGRAVTSPGEGVLELLPVYPPILRCPGNMGPVSTPRSSRAGGGSTAARRSSRTPIRSTSSSGGARRSQRRRRLRGARPGLREAELRLPALDCGRRARPDAPGPRRAALIDSSPRFAAFSVAALRSARSAPR